jgi:NAD(P)-dependent dehydrogenase (short-subunit alcohol dehydrogenase family)
MGFVKDMIPMGRIASVDDVADAVLYLCSAKMVTGHSLLVDGGWTAR